MLARIAAKPDLTMRVIKAELAATEVKVSHGALGAFFAGDAITFKREPHASEQDRAAIASCASDTLAIGTPGAASGAASAWDGIAG